MSVPFSEVNAKHVVLGLVGLALFGLAALGIAVALLLPGYVRERAVAEALERGVRLTPGAIDFSWGWIKLENSRIELTGVKGFRARVGTIAVTLDRFELKKFGVSNIDAEAVGEPWAVYEELSGWVREHEKYLKQPLSLAPLRFSLRRSARAEPLVTLERAQAAYSPGRGWLQAERATLLGRELGALRVSVDAGVTTLAATFGRSTLDNPTLGIESREEPVRSLHVALSPLRLGELGEQLRLKLPLPEVRVSGTADAVIPKNLIAGGPITGRVDGVLEGFVPPHPVELDGFVFGDKTTFGTAYTVEPLSLSVRLDDARVKAGKFELRGTGRLAYRGDHARLVLALRGELPCNVLAGAMAESRLGRALGAVAGKAARQVVGGTVGVRVTIDADSRTLDKARVVKTITPGCGLRPLSFEELMRLGELVPEALDPAVAADAERLLQRELDKIAPGEKIELPDLGGFRLPFPTFGVPPPARRPAPP